MRTLLRELSGTLQDVVGLEEAAGFEPRKGPGARFIITLAALSHDTVTLS